MRTGASEAAQFLAETAGMDTAVKTVMESSAKFRIHDLCCVDMTIMLDKNNHSLLEEPKRLDSIQDKNRP